MPSPKSLLRGFAREIINLKINPKKPKRLTLGDKETPGLTVRLTPKGKKAFYVIARDLYAKQIWAKVPSVDAEVGPDRIEDQVRTAREKAKEAVALIQAGEDPFPAPEPVIKPDSFADEVENFLRRHVNNADRPLRSAPEINRIFNVYVLPHWRDRPFESIRRADVTKLMDRVEDNNGKMMADRVLSVLSRLFNWHALRSDYYSSPIIRGMTRTRPEEKARSRILNSDEIRILWPILTASSPFGAMLQIGLLTAQRRAKLASVRYEDITDDGIWVIRSEPREKGNPGRLKLPQIALDIIDQQPRLAGNPHIFAGKGDGYFRGFVRAKQALDERFNEALRREGLPEAERWTTHDIRRTSRSLMARAGISTEIAERVMGHALRGVIGVYDRHEYADEKADALERLAAVVERIVNSAAGNVVSIAGATA